MFTATNWMLYGAYGTTGRLIVDEALRRGHRPVLAGRNAAKLQQLERVTGLNTADLPLEHSRAIRRRRAASAGGRDRGHALADPGGSQQ